MMNTVRELTLNVPIGISLRNNKILLAASSENAQRRIEPYIDIIREFLRLEGKTLIYLPEIFSSITPEMAAYAFPGLDFSSDAVSDIHARVFSVLQPDGDEIRLVRYFEGHNKFYIVDLDNVEFSVRQYAKNLWTILDVDTESFNGFDSHSYQPSLPDDIVLNEMSSEGLPMFEPTVEESADRAVAKKAPAKKKTKADGKRDPFVKWMKKIEVKMYDLYDDVVKEDTLIENKEEPKEIEVPLELESKTKAIIDDLEKLMNKYNLSPSDIESLLRKPVKLSRLHITKSGRIFLPDYNNRELDLDTKTRALYILFIYHPEGIGYKYLQDYRKELLNIYSSISHSDDLDKITATVDTLVDPMETNAVSVSVSRVKKAFCDIMDERLANNYIIKGAQGKPKKIDLDRNLVKFV